MNTYGLTVWHTVTRQDSEVHRDKRAREKMLADAEVDAGIRIRLIQALSTLRQSIRTSQRAVAGLMGTQQSAVSDLEKGITDPRLSTLQRYARAVGCRLDLQIVEELGDEDAVVAQVLVHYSSWASTGVPQSALGVHAQTSSDPPEEWQRHLEEFSRGSTGGFTGPSPYQSSAIQNVLVTTSSIALR